MVSQKVGNSGLNEGVRFDDKGPVVFLVQVKEEAAAQLVLSVYGPNRVL